MKPIHRILIIVALAVAVGMVLVKKHNDTSASSIQTTSVTDIDNTLPSLVDLGAGKCIPCKAMAPILKDLRKEYIDSFNVVFIDVWEDPPAAEPYNIDLIPTQIFFDAKGNELWRHEGFLGRDDILAKWKELGLTL